MTHVDLGIAPGLTSLSPSLNFAPSGGLSLSLEISDQHHETSCFLIGTWCNHDFFVGVVGGWNHPTETCVTKVTSKIRYGFQHILPLINGWDAGSPKWWDRWHIIPNWQYIPLIYHLYIYIAFWGVICYLPPFRGTRNNH